MLGYGNVSAFRGPAGIVIVASYRELFGGENILWRWSSRRGSSLGELRKEREKMSTRRWGARGDGEGAAKREFQRHDPISQGARPASDDQGHGNGGLGEQEQRSGSSCENAVINE